MSTDQPGTRGPTPAAAGRPIRGDGSAVPVPFSRVLRAEYERFGVDPKWRAAADDILRRDGITEEAAVAEIIALKHRQGPRLAALCFSGGGIRSATFNLGVLQGLA